MPDSVNGNPLPARMTPCTCHSPRTYATGPPLVQPAPAFAKRQLVAEAERAAMALMITREALVRIEIGPERSVVRLDLAGTVVAILRQLVVGKEEQTRRSTASRGEARDP